MVELVQDGKIVAFEQVPAIQWLRCGTSTRRCTFSSANRAENVAEFAQLLRLNPTAMVFSHQIHSDTIEVIDEKYPLQHVIALDGVDAMLTTLRDVMLTVFTADCVPVFFADTTRPIIGIAHCGFFVKFESARQRGGSHWFTPQRLKDSQIIGNQKNQTALEPACY